MMGAHNCCNKDHAHYHNDYEAKREEESHRCPPSSLVLSPRSESLTALSCHSISICGFFYSVTPFLRFFNEPFCPIYFVSFRIDCTSEI
jgi:hypothetical protein